MSTVKTVVNINDVLNFLKVHFDSNIKSVKFIKGGKTSQAFSYTSQGSNFVIRINKKKGRFEKDLYAFNHFKTKTIPIPKILDIGKFNPGYFCCISKHAVGKNLDEWNDDTHRKLLPQLISILKEIHKLEPLGNGYGDWDTTGNAPHDSWKDAILPKKDRTDNLESPKASFYEKDVVKRLEIALEKFMPFITEDRYLVHGDYGFNNIVSDGKSITGVLDWGESMFGDFMYDVSWLEFWSSNINYGQIFKEHYHSNGIEVPNFNERLICYQLDLGIGSLNFFAKSEQRDSYIWTRDKLLSLI